MQDAKTILSSLESGHYADCFAYLYADRAAAQPERYKAAIAAFCDLFGEREIALFSAPGRTEVGGNHTDHQHGRVLAAAVNLDILCVAAKNDDNVIRVRSAGFRIIEIDLADLSRREDEADTSLALVRGIAHRCRELGYTVAGFDAYTTSQVLKGSGLSSSAAFEVAVGTMISCLYNGGRIPPIEIAQIGQFAENTYYGKPSGLMDQMASSVGGVITIDFAETAKPVIEPIAFDFASCGHTLCIVDTRGNHGDLTDDYAAIPLEMKRIAAAFGADYLRGVDEATFYARLSALRSSHGDRAVLRAIHFFGDNARVLDQVAALRGGDFGRFKELVIESGRSSLRNLQNIFACEAPQTQGLTLALTMSEKLLVGRGAWRVHGGGFAGTIQAFVPNELLADYRAAMQSLFGEGSCHALAVRPMGGVEVSADRGFSLLQKDALD
jgi:galactokinase